MNLPHIAPEALNDRIVGEVNRAELAHGDSIRADERRSPSAVAGQRALIRAVVINTALSMERLRGRDRVDEDRIIAVAGTMADALGLRARDGRIDGMEGVRADAYYLPGEGIERDSNPIRLKDQRRAVQESIGSRNIAPGAQLYESNSIGFEGSADVYVPGATKISSADYNVGGSKRQVYTLVTTTQMDWEQVLYGVSSSINQAGEKAEAADRALRRAFESVLVKGAAGTDLKGLFGANRVQMVAYHSALDYSLAATDLGDIYADMLTAAQKIQEGNDDRGGVADTALISPTILRIIQRKSNIDVGGSLTGSELFMAMNAANAGVGQAFKAMGITRVVSAPSLNSVFGAANDETDRAGMALYEGGNADSLRRVLALAPSPVRTAEELMGQRTLWALRTGGLECPDATGAGIATFKVR